MFHVRIEEEEEEEEEEEGEEEAGDMLTCAVCINVSDESGRQIYIYVNQAVLASSSCEGPRLTNSPDRRTSKSSKLKSPEASAFKRRNSSSI